MTVKVRRFSREGMAGPHWEYRIEERAEGSPLAENESQVPDGTPVTPPGHWHVEDGGA